MDANFWGSDISMTKNVRLNKELFARWEMLCQQHTYESKLVSAIELGGVYGLGLTR